jgi:Family of unknown function (DUF5343)
MALSKSYLTSFKNLKPILAAIQSAQAPSKFTVRFLESLGFKNAADRLMIGVLKSLGFLTQDGVPTARYFAFLDQTQGARVLADGIREAYGDLFQVNKKAQDLSQTDIKNKLKTLTQGQASDSVLDKMAGTLKALSSVADFSESVKPAAVPQQPPVEPEKQQGKSEPDGNNPPKPAQFALGGLVYNIQLSLPESRDQAVYDALFKSMKDHLLR